MGLRNDLIIQQFANHTADHVFGFDPSGAPTLIALSGLTGTTGGGVGTVTGATNGLSMSGSGRLTALGGTLTGGTTLNLSSHNLLISASTGQVRYQTSPRLTSLTANQFVKTDSNKDLVSVTGATASDLLTGTDNGKPITSLALKNFRDLISQSVSVSMGTATLDLQDKQERKFAISGTQSGNFTIAFSNSSNAEIWSVVVFITGTVVITFPSSVVCEKDNGRWANGSKQFTVVGGTAEPFTMTFLKIASTPLYELRVSTAIYSS